jgi:uncharacterized protein involved in exopolysaccharide biosynthesis
VVDDLRLADDPEFQRNASTHGTLTRLMAQGMAALSGLVPAGTLQWLGIQGPPARLDPRPPTADPSLSMERSVALSEFGRRLSVTQSGKSYVLAVSFWAATADKAAAIANATADAYLEMLREDKQAASLAANRWLGERLASLRDDYLRARAREQSFRTSNNIVTITGGEDINDRHLIQLQEELIKVQALRSSAMAKLRQAQAMRAGGVSLEGLSEIVDSPLVQRLREEDFALSRREADLRKQYGERHPEFVAFKAARADLRTKIDSEVDRVLSNLQNSADVIAAEESSL